MQPLAVELDFMKSQANTSLFVVAQANTSVFAIAHTRILMSISDPQAMCFIALTDVPVALFQVTEWGQRNIGPHGMGLSGAIGSLVGARLIWAECAAKIKKD